MGRRKYLWPNHLLLTRYTFDSLSLSFPSSLCLCGSLSHTVCEADWYLSCTQSSPPHSLWGYLFWGWFGPCRGPHALCRIYCTLGCRRKAINVLLSSFILWQLKDSNVPAEHPPLIISFVLRVTLLGIIAITDVMILLQFWEIHLRKNMLYCPIEGSYINEIFCLKSSDTAPSLNINVNNWILRGLFLYYTSSCMSYQNSSDREELITQHGSYLVTTFFFRWRPVDIFYLHLCELFRESVSRWS